MDDWRSGAAARWRELEPAALSLVGVITSIVGVGWLGIAANPSPDAQIAGDFRPFAAAVGLATLVAGSLTALRVRDDLVVSILGALAGASFAVSVALITIPESTWSVFSSATIYGALLFAVLGLRAGFGKRLDRGGRARSRDAGRSESGAAR